LGYHETLGDIAPFSDKLSTVLFHNGLSMGQTFRDFGYNQMVKCGDVQLLGCEKTNGKLGGPIKYHIITPHNYQTKKKPWFIEINKPGLTFFNRIKLVVEIFLVPG
jgi:hypothetical protein